MYGDHAFPALQQPLCTGVWSYDPARRCLWWSPATFLIHGLPADAPQPDALGALEFFSPASRTLIEQAFRSSLAGGRPWELEAGIAAADGRERRVRVTGEAVLRDGAVVELRGSFASLENPRAPAFDASSAEQELAQVSLAAVSDGVIRTDPSGRILYSNESAQRLSGLSTANLLGQSLEQLIVLPAEDRDAMQRSLRGGARTPLPAHAALRTTGNESLPVEGSITPSRDGGGIIVFRDLSQTRALAQQLQHQAEHDPLTGLPNRGRFEQELAARLPLARVRGEIHAVLFLDLDRFTLINDTCGHQDGDRLLLLVARELGTRLRPGDVMARIGDDKFGVILDGCDSEHALQKAASLVEAVDHARFRVGERVFRLGLSAGVAGIDASSEDARQVLMHADTACYVAKRLGGNRAQLYQNNDLEVSRTRSDMDWVARIEQALDESRIELFAQRIVPLEGGNAPCYELLVRMRLPDGGFAPPNDFLPPAQRFGLMDKIERSVVRQALDKIERLLRHGGLGEFGYLSVNLSGTSLSDQGFTAFLLRELERYATPPERVRFEITETAALNETVAARNFIASLHRLGYKILLDDFGTGFTSFGYLKTLGANGLKVDQSFTRNLAGDVINQAIVESICKIGSSLGLEIIAEGVEDEVTLQALRSLGVRHAQGWLFHRAEPLELVLPQVA